MVNRSFQIMGIVNTTPDSFSDGGQFLQLERAMEKIAQMVDEGVDIIDLGAESSRPGATPITSDQEWKRLEQIIRETRRRFPDTQVSLDTRKEELMLKGARLGVSWINCVDGLVGDKTLSRLAGDYGCNYVAMHNYGEFGKMQENPLESMSAVKNVETFFQESKKHLLSIGFEKAKIWLDPGIGFGKTDSANLHLMARVKDWVSDHQILVGVSRKSWMGRLLEIESPEARDLPSKMIELGLVFCGAGVIRTHDTSRLAKIRRTIDLEIGST